MANLRNQEDNMEDGNDDAFTTIEFSIRDIEGEAHMKNILLSSLPNLHGMASEDSDTFLFEFDILCWSELLLLGMISDKSS